MTIVETRDSSRISLVMYGGNIISAIIGGLAVALMTWLILGGAT